MTDANMMILGETCRMMTSPHILSISDTEDVKIFGQSQAVRNLKVIDAKRTQMISVSVKLQNSAETVTARNKQMTRRNIRHSVAHCMTNVTFIQTNQ